jgi:hypothetical protein
VRHPGSKGSQVASTAAEIMPERKIPTMPASIVEACVRCIRRWATIPNIRCDGQLEIELLAIEPMP